MSEKWVDRLVALVVVALLGLTALSVRGCWTYDKTRERSCAAAGGSIMKVPSSWTGSGKEGCIRVTKYEWEIVPFETK